MFGGQSTGRRLHRALARQDLGKRGGWSLALCSFALVLTLGACSSQEPPEIRATPLNAADDPFDEASADADAADDDSEIDSVETDDTVATMVVETAPPGDVAQLMQLRLEDFPTGYELSTEVSTSDVCEGYANPTVEFAPLSETNSEFIGDHVHGVGVAVYESAEAALEAMDYAEEVLMACSGAIVEDDDGTLNMTENAPIDVGEIDGVDRFSGTVSFLSFADSSVEFVSYLGVVDSVMFTTMSTDQTVINEMTDRVLARYRGEEVIGEMSPTGSMSVYAGFSDPEYYSWPEGPATIRTIDFPAADANGWIEASTDERIDTVASSACAVTSVLQVGDDVDAMITSVFTDEELGLYNAQGLGEVFGASVNVYCPGFLTNIEAAVNG